MVEQRLQLVGNLSWGGPFGQSFTRADHHRHYSVDAASISGAGFEALRRTGTY